MARQRAFTLIELLVVIATIAILMAILMPALKMAKDQAARIHCVSNAKTLLLGYLMYKDEFDGKLVPGNVGAGQWVDKPANPATDSWTLKKDAIRRGLLFKYVGADVQVYRCPADRRKESSSLPVAYRTFSIAGGASGQNGGGYDIATLYTQIKQPSLKYIFVEEMDTRGDNLGSWLMKASTKAWTDPFAMWHNNKSTLGFADGHGEMHQWKDQSLIDWCGKATYEPQTFSFNMTPPASDVTDIQYMVDGWPHKQ